jgi:mannose/cellobiose epimerase-like protein (N-acyl-D-glucosamine 2-epimerase family)
MRQEEESLVEARLAALRGRLLEWLVGSAYPLWARQGIDPASGGFIELLGQDGRPLPDARRVRVQPRQVSAFAQSASLGWRGDVPGIVRAGMDYLAAHYRRADGFYRTLISADGAVLDDRALLYDQSFVLLGFASAALVLDARVEFERRALELRDAIERHWRGATGGFSSGELHPERRESNPHMHLLEACLAWAEIGSDPSWAAWADEIADLALARFVYPQSGALGEAFTANWEPAPGTAGQIIEPGHQFEWAWLLMRCRRRNGPARVKQALRLIAIGEDAGVRGEVAVNALLEDLSVHDPRARLWPQTERLKSTLLAAAVTGESHYLARAAQAAMSLFLYLETEVAGLWFDMRLPDGTLIDQPAPASTFYHLVGAISALDTSTRAGFKTNGLPE